MMTYEASRLARDPEECIRLINGYLEDPTLDSDGRRRAREQDCGPLGQAGKRIADAILHLIDRPLISEATKLELGTEQAISLGDA
jgi:hypothetical protein